MGLYRSATSLASWGWLLPVSNFIELVAMGGYEDECSKLHGDNCSFHFLM